MVGNFSLSEYYAHRALEYDSIYLKPERQRDLASLRSLVQNLLRGQDVLELACGTGYWTKVISETARRVLATDINDEVLALARARQYPEGKVRFAKADAFDLKDISGTFSAGFAGFWWSHIRHSQIPAFLRSSHGTLGPGTWVVFVDNTYVEGSSSPISRVDVEGNTYQSRRLKDGTRYEVLKNFPSEETLRRHLKGLGDEIRFTNLRYYWCLSYKTV